MNRAFIVGLSIFLAACAGERTPQYHQKLVVLAFDGLDPDLVSQYMSAGKLPNIRALVKRGALQALETTPSPDASAWASFATGVNPGKHGVFSSEITTRSGGTPFWTLAGRAGVRSTVLSVALTYPPEDVPHGELLSGWPAPDLRQTSGTFFYYGTDVSKEDDGASRGDGGIHRRLTFDHDVARTELPGAPDLSVPVSIFWNHAEKAATVDVDGTSVRLAEGEWSKWIDVVFGESRWARLVHGQHGMVELNLVHAGTTLGLYASPVQMRADRPALPLSSPPSFASDLFERVGSFRTLGWPEATAALDANLIDDKAFMDDVYRAFDDRAQIFLQRLDTRTWDLLVGEIDTVDHVEHVMWRNTAVVDPIERMYRRCDDLVGETMKHLDADTELLVVSAYGQHAFTHTFDLSRWLLEEGLASKASATMSGGIVVNPDAHDIEDHLVARLTALLDPATKAPIITAVYKRAAIYDGPFVEHAPDLQVGFAPGYRVGQASAVLAANRRKWSADHVSTDYKLVPGTLISSRPTTTESPRVVDLAPTVLRYFGVPIPTEIDGTPLF